MAMQEMEIITSSCCFGVAGYFSYIEAIESARLAWRKMANGYVVYNSCSCAICANVCVYVAVFAHAYE